MQKNNNVNKAYYKVIKTEETDLGKTVTMYGIEGVADGEMVSVAALSSDRERIERLVTTMNRCGLELCQLKDVVDDFLYEYNKRMCEPQR